MPHLFSLATIIPLIFLLFFFLSYKMLSSLSFMHGFKKWVKRTGITFFLLLSIIVIFLSGAAYSEYKGWFSNTVKVQILNSTEKPIKDLTVSCGSYIETIFKVPNGMLGSHETLNLAIVPEDSGIGCFAEGIIDDDKKIEARGGADMHKSFVIRLELKPGKID